MDSPLTVRELQILNLLKEGYTHKEIAIRLHLSINTITQHNRFIWARLGARNTTHAVVLALRRGIIHLGV